nr:MAK10-like protein [Tanacetum cinerariifolium]
MGDANPIRTLGDYSKPSHKGYMNTIELPVGNKVVKAISLPQDVPSTSDRYLIELKNQVQRLMEAHIALMQPTQVNKITSSCEISSGPNDTQYCMKNPEQAFVEYASSCTDEAGGKCSINTIVIYQSDPRNDKPEEEEQERKDNPKNINTNPSPPPNPSVSFIIEKVRKLNSFFESLGLVSQSSNTKNFCTKGDDSDVMFIEIIKQDNDSHIEEPEVGENTGIGESEVEYFDIFPTGSELAYHKYLMCGLIPLIFLRNPIIAEGCPSNLKIPCNIRHVHVEKSYIDPNSPLNIMTRMMYNWIMRRKLDPKETLDRGDISPIIDLGLSQVVLGKPFVEISNMTHDPPKSVVRFTNGTNEVAYKMPHKIEQYNSPSNLEKDHTKSVYLRNEEDMKRGVEYVMSKVLEFYKECLELGREYVTGMDDE